MTRIGRRLSALLFSLRLYSPWFGARTPGRGRERPGLVPHALELAAFGFARLPVVVTFLVALGGVSFAAERLAARTACISSVLRLCPSAALTGDQAAAKTCLLSNLTKATPECQAAVKAAMIAEDKVRLRGP
jgi:hypothetical protein